MIHAGPQGIDEVLSSEFWALDVVGGRTQTTYSPQPEPVAASFAGAQGLLTIEDSLGRQVSPGQAA